MQYDCILYIYIFIYYTYINDTCMLDAVHHNGFWFSARVLGMAEVQICRGTPQGGPPCRQFPWG